MVYWFYSMSIWSVIFFGAGVYLE